jgi:putative transposase
MLELVPGWREYLDKPPDESLPDKIHAHTRTGRPLGTDAFVKELEARLARTLRPQKRGPKPRAKPGENLDLFLNRDSERN